MTKHQFSQMKYKVSIISDFEGETAEFTLPELIRTLRHRQGLTASALAKKCEVSRNYVGQIEHGQANPTLTVLVKILDALGYQINLSLKEKQDDTNSG